MVAGADVGDWTGLGVVRDSGWETPRLTIMGERQKRGARVRLALTVENEGPEREGASIAD